MFEFQRRIVIVDESAYSFGRWCTASCQSINLEEPNRLPSSTRINSSVCPSVRLYIPADQVFSGKWHRPNRFSQLFFKIMNLRVKCESEILRKKYICESNTVNNMKLMILEKIRVIRTCSSAHAQRVQHASLKMIRTLKCFHLSHSRT